jgi:hypothetical protein
MLAEFTPSNLRPVRRCITSPTVTAGTSRCPSGQHLLLIRRAHQWAPRDADDWPLCWEGISPALARKKLMDHLKYGCSINSPHFEWCRPVCFGGQTGDFSACFYTMRRLDLLCDRFNAQAGSSMRGQGLRLNTAAARHRLLSAYRAIPTHDALVVRLAPLRQPSTNGHAASRCNG